MKQLIVLVLNIFIFLIIFKVNLFGVMPFSIDKIFIVMGGILFFFSPKMKSVTFFSRPYIFILLIACYGILISLYYNYEINHQVYRFILFALEAYTVSFLILHTYVNVLRKNVAYVYKAVFYCILIQSILIILSFLNPIVFNLLDTLTPMGDTNIDESSFRLYRGLNNNSGSAISIVLSLGALLGLYLYSQTKKYIYPLSIIPIFLATAINGRTGILLILLFIFIYGLLNLKRGSVVMTVFIAVIALFIVQFSVGYFFSQNERSDQILGWYGQVFEIFDKSKAGGNAANSFAQGHLFLPNSQSEILFGSGFDTSDYLNGQGSDSGVIKNIFSFGIILTFVFYFLMGFKIYTSNKSKHIEETLLTLGLLAVLIIGEVKEPFLLKTFLAKLIFITVIGRNIFYRNKMMF